MTIDMITGGKMLKTHFKDASILYNVGGTSALLLYGLVLNNAPTMMQAPARMAARNWQNGTGTVVPMRPNKIRSSPPLQLETDFNSGEGIKNCC